MTCLMNFDWEMTNRPFCIFIPNFHRLDYVLRTLQQFKTEASKDSYMIVVGFDDGTTNLIRNEDYNLYSMALKNRYGEHARNGSFIRNYFIKRNQAKILFQKDPETILYPIYEGYDWIKELVQKAHPKNPPKLIRPYFTQSLNEQDTGKVLENLSHLHNINRDIEPISPQYWARFHWGFSVPSQDLISVGGYDEEYTVYGPEDRDLYERLISKYGLDYVEENPNLRAVHLWHPVLNIVYKQVADMQNLFATKRSDEVVRNLDKVWGEG